MDQSIIVKYRWTADDLIEAYRWHSRQSCRPIFRLGLNFIIGGGFLSGVAGCFQENGYLLALSIAAIVVGVYWFAIRPFDRRWMIRRRFAKRPDKDIDSEWEIATDRITERSRLGHSEFSWEALVKVLRAPSGLMLYPLDNLFYYLPQRGFASDSEFERAVELAKGKVKKFVCVR